LHSPVRVLNRRSCGDRGEILSWYLLHEELADAMSIEVLVSKLFLLGASWEVLVSRSYKIRSSSRSLYDDLVRFS